MTGGEGEGGGEGGGEGEGEAFSVGKGRIDCLVLDL